MKAENLYSSDHKATSNAYRSGYDDILWDSDCDYYFGWEDPRKMTPERLLEYHKESRRLIWEQKVRKEKEK